MTLTPAPRRTMVAPIVQTAAIWPTGPGGWTTQPTLICLRAREGFTNDLGEAALIRYSGKIVDPGAAVQASRMPLSLLGHYVRISISDDPIWWGVIRSQTRKPAGDVGQIVTYNCAGLGYVLDQITPRHGYVSSESASDPSRAADWPTFNERDGGDKSATGYTIGGMSDVRVIGVASGLTKWTALDAVNAVLAAVTDQCPGGPRWAVAGQTTALATSEQWEMTGTALEMLARLINPRHGLGFAISVNDATSPPTAVITVMSALDAAITAGGAALPAADSPLSLDYREDRWVTEWNIAESCDAQYDFIGVEGSKPWWCLTLGFKNDGSGQLTKGWTASQEAAWDAATDEACNQGQLAHVWRRFVLRDGWAGATYSTPGSPRWLFGRAVSGAGDANYGEAGETGEPVAGQAAPSSGHYRFTRAIPLYQSQSFNWDSVTLSAGVATGVDRTKPLMPPLVFVVKGSTWEEAAPYWDVEDIALQPEEDAPALILGSGVDDAERNRAACEDDGQDLVFTVGIHHPLPLRVSWRRLPANRVRDQDRQVIIPAKAERWIMANDTVVRAILGVKQTKGTEAITRDDVDLLRQTLALARAWYSPASIDLSWTERGNIVIDSRGPGRLVTSIVLPTGIDSPTFISHAIGNVITSRAWDFTEESYGTSWQTKRIAADIEAVR